MQIHNIFKTFVFNVVIFITGAGIGGWSDKADSVPLYSTTNIQVLGTRENKVTSSNNAKFGVYAYVTDESSDKGCSYMLPAGMNITSLAVS